MRAAIYARVSTADQHTEQQVQELRRYVEARGWTIAREYVDQISGAKEHRPALDAMLTDAKRRRIDVVCVWRLDRLGRNLKHLITLIDELHAVGVAFLSLNEGIDCTTPAGNLQLHVLGALAEFERGRIRARGCRSRQPVVQVGSSSSSRLEFPWVFIGNGRAFAEGIF